MASVTEAVLTALRVRCKTVGLSPSICQECGAEYAAPPHRCPAPFELGDRRWMLLEGDSLEVMTVLRRATVDHVITDPPFEAEAHTLMRRRIDGAHGATVIGGRRPGADGRPICTDPIDFAPITADTRGEVSRHIGRLTRRWSIVFCQLEAAHLWTETLEAHGTRKLRVGGWVKTDPQPQLSGDRPAQGGETIVYAHAAGKSTWNGGGASGFLIGSKHNADRADDHPTQKPLWLMLELIRRHTDPGDLILDPFAGSGSTGVAALRLGRRFVGIEKDPKYAALARRRLEAESNGNTLAAHDAGQLSMFGGAG